MLHNILILFIFSLVPSMVQAKIVDRIVAVVNDEIITLSDLRVAQKKMDQKVLPKDLLNALIEDKLTRQLVKKLRLTPETEEVESQINAILKQQGLTRKELLEFLKNRGLTYKEYQQNIQKSMENERLLEREIKSSINIKEQDIRSYYYSHIKDVTSKKTYHIRQLFFSIEPPHDFETQKAMSNKAYEESKKGKSLDQIAKDIGDTASISDLGFIEEVDLNDQFKNTINLLEVNQISRPVVTKAGIHILELKAIKEEKSKDFSEAKNDIQKILYEKEFKKILTRWLKTKKEQAHIKIFPLKKELP